MPGLETEELGEWGPVSMKDYEGPVGRQKWKEAWCKEREWLIGLNAKQREEVVG